MNTNCPYCQQAMTYPNQGVGPWTCETCNVEKFLIGYGKSVICLSCFINGYEYMVSFSDRITPTTTISRWIETDDGIPLGDNLMSFDYFLPITPDNIREKLKLYLVFS